MHDVETTKTGHPTPPESFVERSQKLGRSRTGHVYTPSDCDRHNGPIVLGRTTNDNAVDHSVVEC